MYEFVKVFGERNSGTNFLNLMLHGNGVHATILDKDKDFLPAEWVLGFAEQHRDFFVERYLDQLDRQEFSRNFGWKHARVSFDRFATHEMFPRTFFILLVRNPYNFVSSLHRRNYNILPPVATDRKSFIRAPLMANERDHVDNVYVRTPVDLWNQKTLAAIDLTLKVKNACLVRYEDVVRDTIGFIRWLSRAGLVFDHDDIVPMASTKRDPIRFEDYRAKALNFDPAEEFDAEDHAFIRDRIPEKLARMLGYDLDRTTFPDKAWTNEMFSYLAV